MYLSTDMDDILTELEELSEKYDIPEDELNGICRELRDIENEYENRISDLESESSDKGDEIDELQGKLDELSSGGGLELYATYMLQSITGYEPSLGDVLSLKDDLEKLLTTKHNIPMGNL